MHDHRRAGPRARYRISGRDFFAWGYEDADDYLLFTDYVTEDFRLIPLGEQPTMVSKATGDGRNSS